MSREMIFDQINEEREYQDTKWGSEFDDKNTANDWVAYISYYAGKTFYAHPSDQTEVRNALLKSAALAVAAIEAFDRNNGFPKRHYD